MARNQTIRLLRTTRAALDTAKAASELILGEPYFITDEDIIAVGTGVDSYIISGSVGAEYTVEDKARVGVLKESSEPSGFNRLDSTTMGDLSFDPVTKNVSVAVASGETEFSFYVKGIKHTKTTTQSVTVTTVLSGDYWVYFDDSGTLTSAYGVDLAYILENALVMTFYCNVVNDEVLFGRDERHGIVMDGTTHAYFHTHFGARFVSGMTPDLTIGSSVLGASGITAGVIDDEDIRLSVDAETTVPIIYREGAVWRKTTSSTILSLEAGTTGRPAYNYNNGGSWEQGDPGNNDFVLMHLVCASGLQNGYALVQGQADYANGTQARAGVTAEISNLYLDGMPTPEMVWVASFILDESREIYATADGDTFIDLRGSTKEVLGEGSVTQDHASLLGLQGGAAGEYYHLTTAQVAEIAANTLKETNVDYDDTDVVKAPLGVLPILDGSQLTGLASGGFTYTETTDPLVTTNPVLSATWLNSTSGEIFVCIDNTTDENTWVGQLGTVILFDDIYFNSVVLLLSMDGSDGGITFTDLSSSVATVTAEGNAAVSTARQKFGTGSLELDATSSYLETDQISLAGDFTIECWIYHDARTQDKAAIFSNYTAFGAGSLSLFAGHNGASTTQYQVAVDGVFPAINAGILEFNEWIHVALVRYGTTMTLYIGGVSVGTCTSYATLTTAASFYIGVAADNIQGTSFDGAIDEFRITNGVARYLESFSVPATAFPPA